MNNQEVQLKDLTIDRIKSFVSEHSLMILKNPNGELFQNESGLLIDVQSLNLMKTIYDKLSEKNQNTFNSVLQNEYKLARFIDGMWGLVR